MRKVLKLLSGYLEKHACSMKKVQVSHTGEYRQKSTADRLIAILC